MFRLEKLKAIVKKSKTVGRGGDRGGSSGRGGKGQTQRSGGSTRIGFEGGQMPLIRRLPKRGFNNASFRSEYEIVNLESIDARFDDGATVTKQDLIAKGLLNVKKGLGGKHVTRVKVLAQGGLTKKLIICADAFSKAAEQAIVHKGGQARIIEEN
jgi:ribosomal protein L15, bacterial/organelle